LVGVFSRGVGREMGVLDEGGDPRMARGSFGGKYERFNEKSQKNEP